MPKNRFGNLGHESARYALHRLFMDQHGWFVRGLEPTAEDGNVSSPASMVKEWVPSYLQGHLERLSGERGLTLRQLAVLAATLQDFIHNEAIGRLEAVYRLHDHGPGANPDNEELEQVIDTFMSIYVTGADFANITLQRLAKVQRVLGKESDVWSNTKKWVRKVEHEILVGRGESNSYTFNTTEHVVEEIVSRYGKFNDLECKSLKATLLKREDDKKA